MQSTPTTSPHSTTKFQRARKDLRVYFRIRSGGSEKVSKKQLLIRLTVDGETAGDYASGVYVRPEMWDQSDQQCRGRSKEAAEINQRLAEIELAHREILRELKERHKKGQGPRPNAGRVKLEYITPGATDPDLMRFYTTYYEYVESLSGSEDGKAKKTMDRLRTAEKHLSAFLPYYWEKHRLTGRYTLRDVNTGMGKQFHAWLQVDPLTGKRKMQKTSANKYLSVLRDCLEYATECEYISKNPLDKFRPKRGKSKDIYFLSNEQVTRLMDITTDDRQYGYVLWWTRLMCFTGLDYCDAVRYARDRATYERETEDGVVIWIKREKPPRNYCEIPILPQVEFLFLLYPEGPPDPELADVNRHLKLVQTTIGMDKRFTTKICRKSAGAIFARMGYQINFVSKILGHSSIRTTLQHYLTVEALSVQAEMARVNKLAY